MTKVTDLLTLIRKVIAQYVSISIGKVKFKGKIIITVNCIEGTVGSVNVEVSQNFSQKNIDNFM